MVVLIICEESGLTYFPPLFATSSSVRSTMELQGTNHYQHKHRCETCTTDDLISSPLNFYQPRRRIQRFPKMKRALAGAERRPPLLLHLDPPPCTLTTSSHHNSRTTSTRNHQRREVSHRSRTMIAHMTWTSNYRPVHSSPPIPTQCSCQRAPSWSLRRGRWSLRWTRRVSERT